MKAIPFNLYANLLYQKKAIEVSFDYLHCSIDMNNKVLICSGVLKPNMITTQYKIRLTYKVGSIPVVKILSPIIVPNKHIHMYSDGSLCLYYEPDMKWGNRTLISKYTIPWITEWILYYELYKVNGNVWEGRESPSHIDLE
jgi:hypothetical protein